MSSAASASLRQALRPVAQAGAGLAILFVGGFAAWSIYAPLASAAIAPGIVSPDSSRKTVQHLEGGIVHEILVREGDQVAKGAVLMRLSPTQARASFSARQHQSFRLDAERLRLQALKQGVDALTWPTTLSSLEDDDYQIFLANQDALFELQRRALDEKKKILERRKGQIEQEIAAVERENEGTAEQLRILSEEITDKMHIFKKGLARKPELLALQRLRAELVARSAANEASIARSQQAIEEVAIAILSAETEFHNSIAEDSSRVNSELSQLEQGIASTEDVLLRTDILAPVAGTVLNLRAKTIGGVVGPGEPILDIVPEEDALVFEARLSPNDIDVVTIGQMARIHLGPYSARNLTPLMGNVVRISPDIMTDDATRQAYYEVRVQVGSEALVNLPPDVMLKPGMQAEVFILSTEQTLFGYMSAPIVSSFRRAFREE
ncbi:HlyD family type I secretion periplasmic adaptor subunit [Mesorhizobium sp.]|uniref:HlyD family type I secretion periplasmic adaptor subunit n=1 Tax=Mesorhizobium sp. TaxID=1871066 RepID=UPI00120F9E58|nr:HlyD family type I secretion periplasmic adaptor subunit [Mesorhizobium sp.]TIL30079.1 MAG: HlyD family type I secretion periplasmic adaptor subunit [Mesorhizobium sp.]TIL48818.1 MAG: HlyD family type I secretion periplasmic adaptor subunit [Mesorhizobium sp.]